MQVIKSTCFHLKDGEKYIEVDAVRFAVVDENDKPISNLWTFWCSKNRPDFYVTASDVQSDMKASIHSSRAQFGFLSNINDPFSNWQGPIPSSKHLEILEIPLLRSGDAMHVVSVAIPGFGLRRHGRDWPKQKQRQTIFTSRFPDDVVFKLDAVLVEGDWTPFARAQDFRWAIGLLTNVNGRHLLLFAEISPDTGSKFADEVANSLARIRLTKITPSDEPLSGFFTSVRKPNQAITLFELHTLKAIKSR